MSAMHGAQRVQPCPDRFLSFRSNAMWLEHSGVWIVSVSKAFTNSDGEYAETVPWTRSYGVAEVATAIEAVEFGLHDYRNGR